MSAKRYNEEFKLEAVKQVTDRGHTVVDVAGRLGVTTHSLYVWIERYGVPEAQRAANQDQASELRRLKAELKRVTEERDILKKPRRTLPRRPGEVRVHRTACCRPQHSPPLSDA